MHTYTQNADTNASFNFKTRTGDKLCLRSLLLLFIQVPREDRVADRPKRRAPSHEVETSGHRGQSKHADKQTDRQSIKLFSRL